MNRISNPSEVKGLMAQKKNFFITKNSIKGSFYRFIEKEELKSWKDIVEKIGGGCKYFEALNFEGFSIYVDENGRGNMQEKNDIASIIAGFPVFGNAFVIFNQSC